MTKDIMTARRLLEEENVKKASNLLSRVLQKDPNNVEALFFYGNALLANDDCNNARQQFEKALALEPNAAPVLNAMGLVLFRLKLLEDSEAMVRQACTAAPDNLEPIGNL